MISVDETRKTIAKELYNKSMRNSIKGYDNNKQSSKINCRIQPINFTTDTDNNNETEKIVSNRIESGVSITIKDASNLRKRKMRNTNP